MNRAAVEAIAEKGVDISQQIPQPWADEIVRAADVVVTMGCGDACPVNQHARAGDPDRQSSRYDGRLRRGGELLRGDGSEPPGVALVIATRGNESVRERRLADEDTPGLVERAASLSTVTAPGPERKGPG